jgi:hypothetical protein
MDFSGTELFIEVLVAGILFAFGVSPVLIYFSQASKEAGFTSRHRQQADFPTHDGVKISDQQQQSCSRRGTPTNNAKRRSAISPRCR